MSKPTHRSRFQILAMIFVTVVINYLDRTNISIASLALNKELHFSIVQMGYIFSAFSVTYASMQIPGGILVDRVRARILYPVILFLWSLMTLVQGIVSSFMAFVLCRGSIGIFEAPSYPINNQVVTAWFPEEERASAIAVYTSGQFIGLAFLTPILVVIQNALGWRGLFIVSGVIGFVWAGIWYIFYRDPETSRVQSEDPAAMPPMASWADLREAFVHRKLWGIYLGQFCLGSLFIFFLTWFPTYLVEFRGLDFIKSGFLASIPFLLAFVGVLLSGFLSDFFVRKGYSRELSRKVPVLVGMLLSVSIIGANYTNDTFWVIFFLSLAFLGYGLSSITWLFVSIMAPRHMIGLVGGVFNFIGGLSAAITPTVIGYPAQDGDFEPALLFIGTMALLGFFSYIFLVGKVEQIKAGSPG
ncbi:MFS transporter [Dyadobacter jiangsuensis]